MRLSAACLNNLRITRPEKAFNAHGEPGHAYGSGKIIPQAYACMGQLITAGFSPNRQGNIMLRWATPMVCWQGNPSCPYDCSTGKAG